MELKYYNILVHQHFIKGNLTKKTAEEAALAQGYVTLTTAQLKVPQVAADVTAATNNLVTLKANLAKAEANYLLALKQEKELYKIFYGARTLLQDYEKTINAATDTKNKTLD